MDLIKGVIDKVASPILSWPRLETYTLYIRSIYNGYYKRGNGQGGQPQASAATARLRLATVAAFMKPFSIRQDGTATSY